MLKKILAKTKKEDGNSLILMLVTVPVIMLVFGLAIDLTIWSYTSNNVQKALDNSSVVYASALKGIGTKPQATTVYNANLDNIRGFLKCPEGLTCGVVTTVRETPSEVQLNVTEGVKFVFLPSLINLVPDSSEQVESLKNTLGTIKAESTAQIR